MAVANGISSDEKRLRRCKFKLKNMPPHYRHFSHKKLPGSSCRVFHAGRDTRSNARRESDSSGHGENF